MSDERTHLGLAARIFAVVTNADIYTTFSYIGTAMGGVRVQVAIEDLPRAQALLEADRQALLLAHPWICSQCNEQNEPSFELCWNCGKPLEDDVKGRIGEPEEESPSAEPELAMTVDRIASPRFDQLNPYHPAAPVDEPQATPAATETLAHEDLQSLTRRALTAAVIGLILCPPLINFYSLFLVFSALRDGAFRIASLRYRLILALVIDFSSLFIPLLIL